jgi:hypothetical protein
LAMAKNKLQVTNAPSWHGKHGFDGWEESHW